MAWGKTNIQGIKDTNLTASNIKNGVSIGGVTGIFPNDGTAGVGDVLSGKTFYSSSATKLTGTGISGLGSIYIAVNDFNYNFGAASGGFSGSVQTGYSVNIGNYIYSFAVVYCGGFKIMALRFTTNSSALPVRQNTSLSYPIAGSTPIVSQYVNNGKIYFNGTYGLTPTNYYDYYDTSNNTFSTGNSGWYTSGTQIISPLQLNGFQYDPIGLSKSDSGTIYGDIQTKVTKL